MPNDKPSTPKRPRRSAVQKEMDAFETLVKTLRPLTPEQRERLYKGAMTMMPEELKTA